MEQTFKQINEAVHAPKGALISATGTASVGIATVLDWIPDIIGSMGTFCGLVLTLLIMYKKYLEIRIIKRNEKINALEIKCRMEAGEPCRRHNDIIED